MRENELRENEMPEEEIVGSEPAMPSAASTPPVPADLLRTAADPALTEDLALALLHRTDLPSEVLEQLARNTNPLQSRKVRTALVCHPHTPRHVSVPLARQFYTFDLMKVGLAPGVPADVKVAVDDVLISRLKTITVGERLTLARRSSGRVAAALLLEVENVVTKNADVKNADAKNAEARNVNAKNVDATTIARETRVMHTALENPRLTEALIIKAVLDRSASAALVDAVARHSKWSHRREIRVALLRSEHLSLARALEFSRDVPAPLLQEILASSRLSDQIKAQLQRA
jgi:hypothetical protein